MNDEFGFHSKDLERLINRHKEAKDILIYAYRLGEKNAFAEMVSDEEVTEFAEMHVETGKVPDFYRLVAKKMREGRGHET